MFSDPAYLDQLPYIEDTLYLNHGALNPVPHNAVVAMQETIQELSHPSPAVFEKWFNRRSHLRQLTASLINADETRVALTLNTSDGLMQIARGIDWQPDDEVIVFENEFPANVVPWRNLQTRGVRVHTVSEINGRYDYNNLAALLSPRTKLVAVSFVEYATGFKHDLYHIGRLCNKHDVLLAVDGIQGAGVFELDVEQAGIDFFAAGGYKWLMGGPGTGFFYASQKGTDALTLHNHAYSGVENPFDYSAIDQLVASTARRFETGVPSFVAEAALEKSLEFLIHVGVKQIGNRVVQLVKRLGNLLKENGYNVITNLDNENEISGILLFEPQKTDAEKLAQKLAIKRIVISARAGGLRVAPHFYNTERDIEYFVNTLTSLDH